MATPNNGKSMDVQGTQAYILDVPATDWADCTAAVTAIKGGKKATCVQAYGSIERNRQVTSYTCQDSNDSEKAAGKMEYGDYTVSLLFKPDETEGQKSMRDALDNNTPIIFALEAPNTGGKNGTVLWTKALVIGEKIDMPDSGKYLVDYTLSLFGGITTCPAA